MFKLKLFFAFLVSLLVMGLGWWFSSENSQPVSPVFLTYELPRWNLGLWMFAMLLVGVLLGYFVSLFGTLRVRSKASSLQRKLANREQEIAKLRSMPLKE